MTALGKHLDLRPLAEILIKRRAYLLSLLLAQLGLQLRLRLDESRLAGGRVRVEPDHYPGASHLDGVADLFWLQRPRRPGNLRGQVLHVHCSAVTELCTPVIL